MNRKRSWVVLTILALVAAVFLPHAATAAPLAGLIIGDTEVTANIDELMKVTFDDVLIGEVVTDTELLDLFPDGKIKRGSEGRYFETSQLYQNPGSIGSRSENGYIPQPNGAKAKNGRINLKKIVGSIEETAEVLKKIKGDKAAFCDWAEEQFPRFKENVMDEYDRQLVGDGSGVRARVNAAVPDANALVIDSTFGVAGMDHALKQFRRGMHLKASSNHAGSALRALTMTVDDIDWDLEALVVDQLATGLSDNDYLAEGDAADNSYGKDMMGLYGLVDDGGIVLELQNIDRDDFKWFRSYVRDAGGLPVTEALLIDTDRIARLRGGGKVDTIITSEEAFNAVWSDLKADRNINDPRAYTAGRKGIDILFGGTRRVELRTALKLPSTGVFGLMKSQFRKFIMHEWQWDDTTGAIWKQVVDATGRKDAFYAYGTAYGEIAITSPQKCWRLDGFSTDIPELEAD